MIFNHFLRRNNVKNICFNAFFYDLLCKTMLHSKTLNSLLHQKRILSMLFESVLVSVAQHYPLLNVGVALQENTWMFQCNIECLTIFSMLFASVLVNAAQHSNPLSTFNIATHCSCSFSLTTKHSLSQRNMKH